MYILMWCFYHCKNAEIKIISSSWHVFTNPGSTYTEFFLDICCLFLSVSNGFAFENQNRQKKGHWGFFIRKTIKTLPMHSCWAECEKFQTVTSNCTLPMSSWAILGKTCFPAQTGFWLAGSTFVEKLRLHLQIKMNNEIKPFFYFLGFLWRSYFTKDSMYRLDG